MDEPAVDALAGYLSAQRHEPTAVLAARRLSVGHSRAMYRVDTDGGSFVVRAEQGGVFGTSSGEEFGVMAGLAGAGFPVAPVRWYEPTGSVLGRPFFVMDFVEGAELADERAMDEATAADFVRTMAELHASTGVRPASTALAVRPSSPGEATHLQIERWADFYRAAAAAPSRRWRRRRPGLHHRAPLERVSIVHGDAGPGNVVQADGRIVAVTDWEFAHLGDPPRTGRSACRCGDRAPPERDLVGAVRPGRRVPHGRRRMALLGGLQPVQGRAPTARLDLFERGGNRAEHGHHRHGAAPFVPTPARGGGPPGDVTKAAHRRARAPLLRCGRAPGCGAVGATWAEDCGGTGLDRVIEGRGPIIAHWQESIARNEVVVHQASNGGVRGTGETTAEGRWYITEHLKRRSGELRHAAGVVRRHVRLRGRLVALRQPSPHADLPRARPLRHLDPPG